MRSNRRKDENMILPCTDCKYRTEREEGHRKFIGCSDSEKKKGFIEDDWTYRHRCTNYEKSESDRSGEDER
jgi:hypothetical protein